MPTPKAKIYDLLVSGAGIAGASLALDAAQQGLSVALVDVRHSLIGTGDTRTTAFMPESVAYLKRLSLWEEVAAAAQPLHAMRLLDDRDERRGQPKVLDFQQSSSAPLAFNLPNRFLAEAQQAALEAKGLDLFFGAHIASAHSQDPFASIVLESGQTLNARVCFAADSRFSLIRRALGIAWRHFSDHQTALTARLSHEQPHRGVSTEFHRHDGPMTFVPVAGDGTQSALVWCLTNKTAAQLSALNDEAFLARIQLASQGLLGSLSGLSARGRFPVRPGLANAFSKGLFALMAEAAHVLPPLLAQGLNLSLKDAEIAGNCLRHYGPTQRAISTYANQRWPDVIARLGISEGLNQLLTRSPKSLAQIYDVGHEMLDKAPTLRQAAMRLGLRGFSSV